jgi:diguanylate cyclase (GGDEF)-like protein
MLETQFRIIRPDGQVRHIQVMAKVTRDADGKAVRLTGVNWDVTRQQELALELRHRASHDALTGLYNRAEFDARLRQALNEAQSLGATHALMYIDLDQFKLVNDACGHPVGDELLQEVTALFRRTVRGSDLLARLGGDEFAVILRDCPVEQALRAAQQICECMEEFRFMHGGRRFRVGASIGLVPIDGRWASTAAILQAADTACYSAKEAGRNRPHVWSESDTATRLRQGHMQWAARVEQALDENRYQLFAQRIVPIAHTDDRLHAEVLIRMVDEDGKLAPPGAFLQAAERFHLASRLDRWVLRHVLAWLRQQRNLDAIATIGVNLSGQSISDAAFHRKALEMLANENPLIVSRLCFEVTETAAVTNLDDASRFMRQLRDLGARFALDDFGAGASSFGYLKSLPIDYLKIDGQFVQDVLIDPLDEVTVKCFVEVARVLGVRTVAEFVDSRAVLEHLGQLGVDYAQGYLIHAPAPIITLLPNPAG